MLPGWPCDWNEYSYLDFVFQTWVPVDWLHMELQGSIWRVVDSKSSTSLWAIIHRTCYSSDRVPCTVLLQLLQFLEDQHYLEWNECDNHIQTHYLSLRVNQFLKTYYPGVVTPTLVVRTIGEIEEYIMYLTLFCEIWITTRVLCHSETKPNSQKDFKRNAMWLWSVSRCWNATTETPAFTEHGMRMWRAWEWGFPFESGPVKVSFSRYYRCFFSPIISILTKLSQCRLAI